ncbi:Crp/Fnr family transcriptional regulator [uncultured Roseobacter sp.]|uniref:Crp/Fnr family transcriptional regulator n=1 Tax=uncultured Roseobacter sp. TaxID=114847 RepID=UPI00260ADECD|nr:Crp/Fnr family transcriptional regulator [uncultured Roseobacter sp.]
MIEIMSGHWVKAFEGAPKRSVKGGTVLFHRGDLVKHAYFVKEGRVRLQRPLEEGGLLTLHTAAIGELVAEASLFAERYHCDALVGDQTEMAVLPRQALIKKLVDRTSDASLAMEALASTARDLQALRARVEIMRLRRVSDRLDAYLDLHGTPVRGEWASVADWIGVSPPALYRELAKRR